MEDKEIPVFYGKLTNFRKNKSGQLDSYINERLLSELSDIQEQRNKIITLHLFIEYWLNRILEKIFDDTKITKYHRNFMNKLHELNNLKVLDEILFSNISTINKIRNKYAHELEIEKIQDQIDEMIRSLKIRPDYETTDNDKFRYIVVQTMMDLEEICNKAAKIKSPIIDDSDDLSDDDIKSQLISEGKLFWQSCEILGTEKMGYITKYTLKCPYCIEGKIIREKDDTPGYKESEFWACDNCGLDGDSNHLIYETIKKL
jgi:predicted RNA-binding Zn-ribbon protein involved in translation (DUF1610 family)